MRKPEKEGSKIFAREQKEIDQLIVDKKFAVAYQRITTLLQDESLSAAQFHYLINLQSNTRYAAEAQVLLEVLGLIAPDTSPGSRVSKTALEERVQVSGGGFEWTRASMERGLDYLILHDWLAAHIEGDDIVID